MPRPRPGPRSPPHARFEAIARNARDNLDAGDYPGGRDAQPFDPRPVAIDGPRRRWRASGASSRTARAEASPATPTATSASTTSTGSPTEPRPVIGSWSIASSSTLGFATPTRSPTSPSSRWSCRSRAVGPRRRVRRGVSPRRGRRGGPRAAAVLPGLSRRGARQGRGHEADRARDPRGRPRRRPASRARALWLLALSELEEPGRRPVPGPARRPARLRQIHPGPRAGRAGRIHRHPFR